MTGLEIDATSGWIDNVRHVMSPNCDERPADTEIDLVVIHGISLPPGQFGLYPGMFVKVAFVVGESQRLLVPAGALVRRNEVTGVYVVGDEDRVRLRQVRVGRTFGDRVEILAGLRAGERIATDPVNAGIYLKTRSAQNDD